MKIGVSAITGRMGSIIANAVLKDPVTELVSGLVRKGSIHEGEDLGEFFNFDKNGHKATSDIEELVKSSSAIIDFSTPKLSIEIAKICAKHQKLLVCGTTGFLENEKKELISYSSNTPIIWSSNMSIGVNLLLNLSEKVASILHDDYDVEIFEMHHNQKIDSPSGTALSLGLSVAKGRGVDLEQVSKMSRVGNHKRQKGEIGFSSLRGGDVIGDHLVIFAGDGERVELVHKASNRDIFAKGAIRAAIWGFGKSAGIYSMRDVLS